MELRHLQLLIPGWNFYYAFRLGLGWCQDLRQLEINSQEDRTIVGSYVFQRHRALASGNPDLADEFESRIVDIARDYVRLI
ncbi:MAG: hypothetical protein PHF67_01320 [Candidatus Nanoarchaeia archaeon]|nr:hypothetical protein [Candidatus Nanoarchaeia archaeon]